MQKYTVLQAERKGQPVIIVVNNALESEERRESFPCLLTIELPMRAYDLTTGLCDQAESARLDSVEDDLLSVLSGTKYRLLGHVTGNGAREVMIYVSCSESLTAKLKRALADIGESSGTVRIREDPSWEYYQQFVARK